MSMTETGTISATSGFVDFSSGKSDFQQFVGVESAINFSAGTWTLTRLAQANYVYRKTAGADTTVIGIDLNPIIRTTTTKGFQLNSIDVIYNIATDVLNAHTATLDLVNYVNNTAVAINAVTLSGSLATAVQASPYVTNLSVAVAEMDNTTDSKYSFELTVNATATCVYDFYGLVLKYNFNGN